MKSPDGVNKVCSRCKETKLVSEFTNRKRNSDSLSVECRDCQKRFRHLRYMKNRTPVAPRRPIGQVIKPLKAEEWREVEGFDGKYQVSNMGRMASHAYGYWRILKPRRTKRSQMEYVNLHRDGKHHTRKIHRMVLEAFVGPCPSGLEGCHGNGIPYDNRLTNLRWDTHSSNQLDKRRHGTAGFLSPADVREIRRDANAGVMLKTLAERFDVDPSHISKIVSGKKWRNLG